MEGLSGWREGGERRVGGRCRRVRLTINLSFLRLRERETGRHLPTQAWERESEIDIYPHMPGRER